MRYPMDIVSIVRQKTFSIEPAFVAREEKDDSPLKVFDNTFSRFIFTIIQDGNAVSANIPMEALKPMTILSEECYREQKRKAQTPQVSAPAGGTSPAYTVQFKAGKNKGRTPMDVLLNEANGREILKNEYKWLQSNLDKYPANKAIMDAIVGASKVDTAKVSAGATSQPSPARPVTLLDISARPLTRKQKTIGGKLMCETYEASAVWDFNQKYPVRVSISRYYAPFAKEEDGRLKTYPSMKAKDTVKSHTFDMTGEEWVNSLQAMEDARREYRMINASKMWKMALDAERANREEAARKAG